MPSRLRLAVSSAATVLGAVVCIAVPATAGWRLGGVPVASLVSPQTHPIVRSDDNGGAYIVWAEPSRYRVRLQHLSAEGVPPPAWGPDGAIGLEGRFGADPTLAADGRGGAFVAWLSNRELNFGHVSVADVALGDPPMVAVATHAPTAGGRTARPAGITKGPRPVLQQLVPDGAGGAYLIWLLDTFYAGKIVQVGRLLPNGSPDPAFPWGMEMDTTYWTFQQSPAGCPDGAGGLIVAWQRAIYPVGWDVVATRLTAEGSVADGWERPGMPVCGLLGDQQAVGIASDGTGGALLAWRDTRDGPHEEVFAQRLTAGGLPAPGWPDSGERVCSYPSAASVTRDGSTPTYYADRYSWIAPDGAGGMYVAWTDMRADSGDVYCQRLRADGSVAESWPSDGIPVCIASGRQTLASIAADGSGGLLLAWEDWSGADADIYALRIAVNGTIVDGWLQQGTPVCTLSGDQISPSLAATPEGGAIVAWEDGREGTSRIYACRLSGDGAVAVRKPTVEPAPVLDLSVHGNAVAGNVEVSLGLPGSGAELELFDLSGRLLWRRDLSGLGPGRHRLPMIDLAGRPSGIYLLRLRRQGESVTARLAVVR